MNATLFIISAPSGAGKTSLVRALLEKSEQISVSVSHTTRAKRPGEEHGVDYYFVEKQEFSDMVARGAFLEHAQVFDNFYGTAEQSVLATLQQGVDVVLEIDWQGAQQVRRAFKQSVSIFILPPSRAALAQRLASRGQDSTEIIARRMRDAENETSHYGEYDYIVVNDQFETALMDLQAIVRSERLRAVQQIQRQQRLLEDLLSNHPKSQ